MNIMRFLLVLKLTLNEKYPNLKLDFYVSGRNRYDHMGLDQPLHSISYYEKLINDTKSIWTARKHNDSFEFLSWIDSFSKVEKRLPSNEKKGLNRELCFFRTRVYHLRDSRAMREFHWEYILLLQVMIYMQQSLRF